MTEETFANTLPGNPALPERRQQNVRLAIGAFGRESDEMTAREWHQAQQDAAMLRWSHGDLATARHLTCPPLPPLETHDHDD